MTIKQVLLLGKLPEAENYFIGSAHSSGYWYIGSAIDIDECDKIRKEWYLRNIKGAWYTYNSFYRSFNLKFSSYKGYMRRWTNAISAKERAEFLDEYFKANKKFGNLEVKRISKKIDGDIAIILDDYMFGKYWFLEEKEVDNGTI